MERTHPPGRCRLTSLRLLVVLFVSSEVWAQDSALVSASELEPEPGLTLSADLRSEYLVGEPMLVQIKAQNQGRDAVTIPDLAAQHDLVRFELNLPGGATDNRRTLLDAPSTLAWQIPPRGVREVLLELPASSTLRPGEYKLAIHVKLTESDEQTLPPHTLRLAEPAPVSADLSVSALVSDRGSDLIPWVHKASDGFDLYLFRADSDTPQVPQQQDFLARLPGQVTPSLTAVRATEASSRYVVWLQDQRTISYSELQGHQLRNGIRTVTAPWPRIELAARGVTTSAGLLFQPLWIPAPNGDAGELRVLTTTPRGTAYRRVGRFDARPAVIETVIDDSGAIHLFTVSAGNLDVYSVHGDDDPTRAAAENLPLGGQRLLPADPGRTIHHIRFGILGAGEGYPGGLAMLLLVEETPGTLTPRWMTLAGKPIRDGTNIVLPEAMTPVDVSPARSGNVGLLVRTDSGQLQYIEDGRFQPLAGIRTAVALDRTPEGAPVLRSLSKPIATRMLQPEQTLPTTPSP